MLLHFSLSVIYYYVCIMYMYVSNNNKYKILIITNTVVNKHVKIKEIRVKEKLNPWMTNKIIALIYKRDYTNHMAVRLGSSDKIN